jgi:uncharacterized coiled-coil DUF342 family protein
MAVERWTDEMVDKLAESIRSTDEVVDKLAESVKELRQESKEFREELKQFQDGFKELNIRFSAYQQASQWVVNLAFGLLATATITTIVTAVFRK